MTNNDLLGTLTLVRPDLEKDPAKRQGQIGIITYVDNLENQVYLNFRDGLEGRYDAADLFRLKERETLFSGLLETATNLDVNDFKDLYKISNLQDKGRGEDLWEALEIARDNSNIWEGGLEPLSSDLSRKQGIRR